MATTEFQDWELLHSSSDSDSAPLSCPDSGESFNEIDAGGLIQVNYFSLDAQNSFGEDVDDDDKSAAESDNPSWIDPGSEGKPTRFINRESGEFWSDSGSDRSDDRKFGEMEARKEMILSHDVEREVRVEGVGEILEEDGKKAEDLGVDISSTEHGDVATEVDSRLEPEVSCQQYNDMKRNESGDEVMEDGGSKENGELKKRSVVWWKMPVEFLKYCVFRMSPVWAVSVAAAAMMGFAILGRRLYKMKKRTKGLEIKVTVDGQKVSQVMSRAARLNEAFSIVRRVPVIRPSLPAVGSTTTWPIMSLR
ncbi:pentatricopeptide repeat (PPR) superfamily protein [Striga asiatica]|uniref:Pentatricopeptide repeat (PPR) superfamily protein n=1 Tax=Striga asiatica TaxID=4170 RepID=A0A5A7P435_STRAF|nr:pentatricopeptide repeat (PPR) superfamily protein [Striga asiatica]